MGEAEPGFREGTRGGQRGEAAGQRPEAASGRAEGAPGGEPVLHNGGGLGHGGQRRPGTAARRLRHESLLRLLEDAPGALEPGLVVLDRHLPLGDELAIDLLTRDPFGYPVVVLLCDDDPTLALARVVAIVAALQQGRHLLDHMFAGRGLVATLQPRFLLLAGRFPDATPGLLDLLGTLDVRALEYRLVRAADGSAQLDLRPFHRTSPRPPAPIVPRGGPAASRAAPSQPVAADYEAPIAAARPEDLALLSAVDAEPEAKRLFLEARDTIRTLSPDIVERGEAGAHDFVLGGETLVRLVLERQGLRVFVGADGAGAVVTERAGLDASLGAVFDRFWERKHA